MCLIGIYLFFASEAVRRYGLNATIAVTLFLTPYILYEAYFYFRRKG